MICVMNKQRRLTVTEKKRENKNFIRALFLKKRLPSRRKRKVRFLEKTRADAAEKKSEFF